LKLTVPTTFTSDRLISENVTEIYSDWNSGTTYAADAYVVYNNSTYISLAGSNTNHQPDTSTTWWFRVGPSNLYAMFDNEINTTTKNPDNITVTLKTGFIDTFALLNIVKGTYLKVTMRDDLDGNIVYEKEFGLDSANVIDWFSYFFTGFDYARTTVILTDLPPLFGNAHVTFELEGNADLELGQIVFGQTKPIGTTQYGTSAGITDYSRVDVDEFGQRVFVKRNFAKKLSSRVFIHNSELNRVHRTLSGLRATPVLWIATDDILFEEPLIIYGFFRDFSIEVSYPDTSYCSLELEGLI